MKGIVNVTSSKLHFGQLDIILLILEASDYF